MISKKLYTYFLCLLCWGASFSSGIAQPCFPEGITIASQDRIDDFIFLYPDCDEIEGVLEIAFNAITNLNGLSHIKSVGGLDISSNSLTDLSGLSSLKTIEGSFNIDNNSSIKSLNGLDALDTIKGELRIQFNSEIESLTGLTSLKRVEGTVRISGNERLKSLGDFESLQHVNSSLFITGNDSLINLNGLSSLKTIKGGLLLSNNTNLESLAGLESLKNISSVFQIFNNKTLHSLGTLPELEFIGGDISIILNDTLNDLSGFECFDFVGTETLTIWGNNNLESLEGLAHTNLRNLTGIAIYENPKLKTCAIQSICEFLSDDKELFLGYNESESCNDVEILRNVCQSLPERKIICEGVPFPNPTQDYLMLTCDCDYSYRIKYKIFSSSGRLVSTGIFRNELIDISTLTSGTYIIKFENSDEIDLSFAFVKM